LYDNVLFGKSMYTNCIRNFNLVHARYVFVYTKTLATAELSFYHSIFRVEKSYKRFNEGDFFRKYDVLFSIFRHKGNSARRICKGTPVLASLVRYFLPFALDKSPCFVGSCLGKKKKIMLFSVVFSDFLGSE
jgi:hypothetical protein